MRKWILILISLSLVASISLFAVLPSSAAVVQPAGSFHQLGVKYYGSNNIQNISYTESLPYNYNAQLLLNGNNMALYSTDFLDLCQFVEATNVNAAYNFVAGQSYEVIYSLQFNFGTPVSSTFASYVDPNLIGLNTYFSSGILSDYNTGLPSSTIRTYSSNYSDSITNAFFNVETGILTFDVVLLFRLEDYYSQSYSKILLDLDLRNFATAIPSGNSGMFYATITYTSISPSTSAEWLNLNMSSTLRLSQILNSGQVYTSSIGMSSMYACQATATRVFICQGLGSGNNISNFTPGYSFHGNISVTVGRPIYDGLALGSVSFDSLYLSTGPSILGTNATDTCSSLTSGFNLTINSDLSNSSSSSYRYLTYDIEFYFSVPADFDYYYSYFVVGFNLDTLSRGVYQIGNYSSSFKYDPTGTIPPSSDLLPGGNAEIIGGLGNIEEGLAQGFGDLSGLINGDGSYGSPDSAYDQDVDNYLDAESDLLDAFGYDSLFNEDVFEDIKDRVDWDNIDVPDANSALWFHRSVSPIMIAFPVFIVFPLIIGLIATLLGRRTRI